jgi:hypothetical protein
VRGQAPRPCRFNPGKDLVRIVQEAEGGGGGGTVAGLETGAEKLGPPHTGIRSPDRPARNETLYRLSYCGHSHTLTVIDETNPEVNRTVNRTL